jgi:hypoxanthine phosphoribosyltransferase
MADDGIDVLVAEADIAARVEALAEELAAVIDDSWSIVQLMQGAAPFATDLMRALARRGIHPVLDSLWLESYRDGRESSGRVKVRADLARRVEGRSVLILDDVFDTGRTLAFARQHLAAQGAVKTLTCAFIRKPAAGDLPIDFVGFDCPDRYLVGYGMDDAGRYRGLPYVGALR